MNYQVVRTTRRDKAEAPAGGAGATLADHRRRFIAPLLRGRRWRDADGAGAGAEGAKADLVFSLMPAPSDTLLQRLPSLLEMLGDGGVLVVVVDGDAWPLRPVLERHFSRVARFCQRTLGGSLITEERFAEARVARLLDRGAAELPDCEILIAAHDDLPALSGGVFESDRTGDAMESPAFAPSPFAPARDRGTATDPDTLALRARAVALVERLASLDADHLAAHGEIERLRAELLRVRLDTGLSATRGPADREERYAWPLRDNPALTAETLAPYERRPDDDVVAASRAGARFLDTYQLLGGSPDIAGAVAALNATDRRLASGGEAPDASIVIPVHGQLAYTLNCLESLFAHPSRFTAEIIVVDDASPDRTRDFLPCVDGIHVTRQNANRGFLASANAGAARARGKFIVMLNNDTRVLPGWLDRLLDGFTLFPKAGLVGSKMFFPDGTLQEAGGIVWRDGSAWNDGRGNDPNHPRYCHARQVDYVSGASIAVPADIWRALGGFDPHFAPAYYEDADLCFRLRAAGYETWLQPGSRIIHYEGKTSGTDTNTGAKAHQPRNAGKFLLRHRDALLGHRRHGEQPALERERRARRRALVIEPTCPTPNQDAGSVYTVMVMRLLRALGYAVTFLPEDNFLFEPDHTAALQHEGIACVYAPYDVEFSAYAWREAGQFDVVVVFRASTFARVVDVLRAAMPATPILFNNHDLHYLRARREAEVRGDAVGVARAEALKRRELAVMARADCMLSPSPFEVDLLARELPGVPAVALPLMTAFFGTDVGFSRRRDVCFLGGYGHPPNVDAARYFVRAILPRLRAAVPGIRFVIAGSNPTDEVRALAAADVIVTGWIDDLRDVLDGVRVFVCPLRFGAGMKGKVLTAMAYGVPVVTTPVGIEGIAATPGVHALVADGPAAFSAACLRLYEDADLWERMSRDGQDLVRAAYSPESGRDALRRAIDIASHRLLGVAYAAI